MKNHFHFNSIRGPLVLESQVVKNNRVTHNDFIMTYMTGYTHEIVQKIRVNRLR